MKKLSLVAAIATAAVASNAFAAPYTTTGTAGAINVDAFITPSLTYIAPSANPPISGDWDFTFNGGTVDFTGNVYLGDFTQFTDVQSGLGNMTGTLVNYGVNHAVSGTANWDAGTNTLTYSVLGASGSGVASDYTASAPATCTGTGSIFGNTVCGTAAGVDPDWEGLELTFVFAPDLSSFTGSIVGTSISGSGLAAETTEFNYSVSGVSAVPVPAAAWLFGSALLGLGGIARRKRA